MDSSQTPTENADANGQNEKKEENAEKTTMAKIEAMVTPEQVLSASVAKKRRTITRKRTSSINSKARSQTPMRAAAHDHTSSEEEANETRPNAPERKHRVSRTTSKRLTTNEPESASTNEESETKIEPQPKIEEIVKQKIEEPVAKSDNTNSQKQNETKTDIKIESTDIKIESTKNEEKAEVPKEKVETAKVAIVATTTKERPKSYTDSEKEEPKSEIVKRKVRPKQTTSVQTENGNKTEVKSKAVEEDSSKDDSTNEAVKRKVKPKKIENGTEEAKAEVAESAPLRKSRPKRIPDDSSDTQEQRRSRSILKSVDSSQTSERASVISEDRASSIPRQFEDQINKLVNKTEIMNLLQRAKNTVEEKGREFRRRRFQKTDEKRSQSTPKQLTEKDLLESFRKAQAATAEREKERIRSESARRYSSGSEKSASPEPQRPQRKATKPAPKPIDLPKKKSSKQLKNKVKSNKIIEILDPKTSKVIAVKDVGVVHHMGVLDVFKIFRYFSLREIVREYKKYKSDMCQELALIKRERRRCIAHFIILLILCGLGGIVFKFTEGHFENFYKCGVKRVKRDFIDLLWMKSHNLREDEWKSLARTRLRTFEEELHTAHEAGIHSYSGQKSWSFLNGLFYCMTVVTTIGYGHLYPTTTTGQALTIVYSLIGIPLFLIILTDFGKLFTRCIKFLWSFVRRLYYTGSCKSVRRTAHVQDIFKGAQMMYDIATFRRPSTMDPTQQSPADTNETHSTAPPTPAISNFEIDDEFNLPISVAILLLVIYIFTGAILFQIWEGWDFFASFYFVFISMSTIGFGDYVPRHPIFKIISIVYLVFGLALMSMCINVVQVKLSDTFSQASAKIGATIGLGVSGDGTIKPVPPKPVEMPEVHGSIVEIHVDRYSPTTSARVNV